MSKYDQTRRSSRVNDDTPGRNTQLAHVVARSRQAILNPQARHLCHAGKTRLSADINRCEHRENVSARRGEDVVVNLCHASGIGVAAQLWLRLRREQQRTSTEVRSAQWVGALARAGRVAFNCLHSPWPLLPCATAPLLLSLARIHGSSPSGPCGLSVATLLLVGDQCASMKNATILSFVPWSASVLPHSKPAWTALGSVQRPGRLYRFLEA